MNRPVTRDDVFGLVRPAIDAHTLGIVSVASLLKDCGIAVVVADKQVCNELVRPADPIGSVHLEAWIRRNRITRLGFSYRLDPEQGVEIFHRLISQLQSRRLMAEQGGPLRSLYFAGLPETCRRIQMAQGKRVEIFSGNESPCESLHKLGVEASIRPPGLAAEMAYDEARLTFARGLIEKGEHVKSKPSRVSDYREFGTKHDRLVHRLKSRARQGLLPLMRAHMGPYSANRTQCVKLFLTWCHELAVSRFLDVLSIGTSQLSQSNFGEDWNGKFDGGGVPLNSPDEFRRVWEVSRPMLVRTYAGTQRIPELARMYEETINIAWHAFSFWWFCQIDGRGPLAVRENLQQHFEALRLVAETGKPFEPNVSHHFAFRGADDLTYVVSAVLAARAAKSAGVRHLIVQNMLNTPKGTWGIQDLAKSRAMLGLVRELEDDRFRVILQPRAGLDYLSPDLDVARIQLGAISALMDDIEPSNHLSPEIVHVVSFSEGSHLADSRIIDESIQITRSAIDDYRRLKAAGQDYLFDSHCEISQRQEEIVKGARLILKAIEDCIPRPYTPEGLYRLFKAGFLPVPYLTEGLNEFSHATRWKTRMVQGGVKVVDQEGRPVSAEERVQSVAESLEGLRQNASSF